MERSKAVEREALQNSETQEIYYKDDAGEVFAASPEEAQEAFRSGYKPLTPDEFQKIQKIERFGDQPIKAAVGGSLSALTGGLLDVALQQAGAADIQQGLKEYNPGAWATGDIGTTVGTSIFAMGSGTLGKLAGKTFPGIVAKQSLKIEKELAKKFVKAGISQSGAKILSRGMGGSIDALAYSLKDAISEEALGDPDFNADKMLLNFGLKAAVNVPIGFGFGAAIAGAEVGIPKLIKKASFKSKEAIEQYRAKITKDTQEVQRAWQQEYPETYKKYGDILDDPFNETGVKKRALAEEFSLHDNRREQSLKTYSLYKDLYAKVEDTRINWEKTQRTQELKQLVVDSKGFDPVETGVAQTKLRETFEGIRSNLLKDAQSSNRFSASMIDDVLEELDRVESLVYGPNIDTNRVMRDLIKAKQDINKKFIAKYGQYSPSGFVAKETASSQDFATARLIKDKVYRQIDEYMGDVDLWGAAGVRQTQGDSIYSNYISAKKELMELFGTGKKGQKSLSDNKFFTYLNSINRKDTQRYGEALNNYKDAALDFEQFFMDTAKNLGKEIPEREIKRLVDDAARQLGVSEEGFSLGTRLSSIKFKENVLDGKIGEKVVDGIEKRLLPAYIKQLKDTATEIVKREKRPDQMVKSLTAKEKILKQAEQKIDSFIERFASGKTVKASEITRVDRINKFSTTASGSLLANIVNKVGDDIESIHRFVADEGQMIENINKNLEPIYDFAPNHASMLASKIYDDMLFLANKAPKNPFSESQIKAGKIDWQPSPSEMSKFNRYYQALDNPLVFLKDISEGKLNKEALEVLQQRRPALYTHIIEKLADYLGQNKDKIPYQKRVLIGRIIGVDLDYISNKRYVLGLQQNFRKQKPIDKGVDGIRDTGLAKLDQANSKLTQTQKIERGLE